jgi:FkbM family methyltransferase
MIRRGVDHVPIIEIFLREEYGSIQDDAVVLDIGAHVGTFTIYAATTAHGGRVYAYEPDPKAFEVLQANLRLNAVADSVRAFNVAVAGESSDRELLVSGTSFFFPTLVNEANAETIRTEGIRVGCTTLAEILDANALDRVDLLKMDIEGSEYEVLYATAAADLQRVDRIRMEYHNLDEESRNAAALRRFLVGHGYRIMHDRPTSDSNGTIWAERE